MGGGGDQKLKQRSILHATISQVLKNQPDIAGPFDQHCEPRTDTSAN